MIYSKQNYEESINSKIMNFSLKPSNYKSSSVIFIIINSIAQMIIII